MRLIKINASLFSILFTVINASYAAMSDLQASLYLGASHAYVTPGLLHISSGETDFLQKSSANNAIEGAGLFYSLNAHPLIFNNPNHLIQSFLFGVSYFHFRTKTSAGVELYEMPQFTNYKYTLNLNTNRLMVGTQVVLLPLWHDLTPFLDGSIGAVSIRTHYYEEPIVATWTPDGDIDLAVRTKTNFAYSLGGGIKKSLTTKLSLSLSYLYTAFGKSATSIFSNSVVIASPIEVKLATNSALLGLTYSFG